MRYRDGKISFANKADRDRHVLIHLLNDYKYLYEQNKMKLSEGDREVMKFANRKFGNVLKSLTTP